jgi:DNA-binding transcriptional LysR family regulator
MSKDASTRNMPSVEFDLRQLEIFRQVVERQSFSRAARAVNLAQASVSERIATLEDQVGTRLLDRLGREIIPTKAGELLYKHALLLLDMKENARLEMQEFLGLRRGVVQLGGSTIPGEYIIPGVLGGFREKYPSISVVLTVSDSSHIQSMVLEGELDLGVIGSRSQNKNLIFHELWKDELVLALPPQHRWSKKRYVNVEDLADEPVLFREEGSGTQKILETYLQQASPKGIDGFRPVARLGSSTAVKEGIKAGLGVAVISSRAIDTELRTGLLKALKIKGISLQRDFFMIRDKRRIPSPLCQAMIDYLLAAAKRHDPP